MLETPAKSAIYYHYPACPAAQGKKLPTMHLLLYMSILLTASAVYVPLQPRVDPCEQEVEETEMVEVDATTSDGTAGIGAEFESPFFYFVNPACSAADTNAAKKQIVERRTGTNWILTADTGGGSGKLNAEYILNGQNIKVGSGDAAIAGAAAAQDLVSTAVTRTRVCPVNAVRSVGTPGPGPGQTLLTLRITTAIRGRSMPQVRGRIQPNCRGTRRSLRQCPLKRCTVL